MVLRKEKKEVQPLEVTADKASRGSKVVDVSRGQTHSMWKTRENHGSHGKVKVWDEIH